MPTKFTENVINIISNIPEGKVLTYGTIAALAGSPRGARQVTRILHSSSKKHNLPWHRVVNSKGKISLKIQDGYNEQMIRLSSEGVIFSEDDQIDLKKYLWSIRSLEEIK
jgi:methylated-DNA-protein-cysteine methyltransferase-like protein